MEQIFFKYLLKHTEDVEVFIIESANKASWRTNCLTNLVAFHDGVTVSVDKGRGRDVIYLGFWKALDMVFPPNILTVKLEWRKLDR